MAPTSSSPAAALAAEPPASHSLSARWRHLTLLPLGLLALARGRRWRALFAEMRAFNQALPGRLRSPIGQVVAELTPEATMPGPLPADERAIRRLADLAALLDRRSPLGLCLRRSLTRYAFLRRAGLPVDIHFGARFVNGRPDRAITGHAWLVLAGQPYHEAGEHWRGFTVMLTYPGDLNQEPGA